MGLHHQRRLELASAHLALACARLPTVWPDPAGPHIVNLLLHTTNVLLLFWVLLRATGFAGRSAVVAALFALHPINVQSVAWVAERKNLLSMLLFLLALGAYRRYASWVPQASGGRREAGSVGRYFLVVLLFAFGLMAKPQVITLPLVCCCGTTGPSNESLLQPALGGPHPAGLFAGL